MRRSTMRLVCALFLGLAVVCIAGRNALAQALGQPDHGEPGDRMIQDYFARVTAEIHAAFAGDLESPAKWHTRRPRYRDEYLYMLGLSPLLERTPLAATVTASFAGNGFVVDMLHYQSRPGLYVTANLYRPAQAGQGERFPAVD